MHSGKAHQCLILGGGLAGLMAARRLHNAGIGVTVIDKGRGLGGWLATRRFSHPDVGEGVFDYGAQYFTARNGRFRQELAGWIEAGVARQWSEGFYTAAGDLKIDGEPRYIGTAGIRGIAKHLAAGLDTHAATRITAMGFSGGRWELHADTGDVFRGDSLIMTPPLPQIIALLRAAGLPSDPALLTRLGAVEYRQCIALLALLAGPSAVPAPGGLWSNGNPIRWIADNQQKGISPQAVALTIHAGAEFSNAYWDTPDEMVAAALLKAAAPWFKSPVLRHQLHRWRYSQPVSGGEPEYCHTLKAPAPLILAGDGFSGGRVEGAARSGLAGAEALLEVL